MSSWSSCFGRRKTDDETAPLLPQYNDDTSLQRRLHQKFHTYQQLRAISDGYLPSTEQTITNLRTLLGSDVLNPSDPELSDSGRLLVRFTKQWLTQFIELLLHKNGEDQIQDFIWSLSKSRVSLNTKDLAARAEQAKKKADAAAAYESLRTVGSLLMTNSDFRIFLSDLNTIGREVFADTAFTLSKVAEETGKTIEPSTEEQESLKQPGQESGPITSEELEQQVGEIREVLTDGLVRTGESAAQSVADHITGDQKDTLLFRLKQAILRLRKRPDYNDSVCTISLLIKRYAKAYSRALDNTVDAVQDDVDANPELDRAVHNFWSLMKSFGDGKEWDKLEKQFNKVMGHSNQDPEFETLMNDVGDSTEKLLTDPDFFEHAEEKIEQLRKEADSSGSETSLRRDVEALFRQIQTTFVSVSKDEDVHKLLDTTLKIIGIISPVHSATNGELIQDSLNVFIPLLIQAIQYVPIPRLEVSVPEADLLLENIIIEPGRTINNTSFLPYRFRFETYNDFEVRKARFRTTTRVTSLATIKLEGLSLRADEVGFWVRAHTGLLRLADEGIANFHLDEKGIDIYIDVEIGRERLEHILSLRNVRVKVHHLNYNLRKSKFSWIAFLFKPLIRPIVRKVMEKQLSTAISDFLHAANRELLYARERLRATRIADPKDLATFFRAVIARLTPEEDPDLYVRPGVAAPSRGIFAGVYAPGSVTKLWIDEAARAEEVIDDNAQQGWRNAIFDVQARAMGQ